MLREFFENLYVIFVDVSVYVMLGLLIVGILDAFVNKKWIVNQIGDNSFLSVVKAAIIGIPLPLCSCGVIPTAVGLKKAGGSNGAVTSFLVSTPQTGLDSIIITWGIMGGFMAVLRPIAALITGILGGIMVNIFGKNESLDVNTKDACDCEHIKGTHTHHEHIESDCSCCEDIDNHNLHNPDDNVPIKHGTIMQRVKHILHYAFGSFLDDIAIYFIIGIIISAVITTVLPDDFFMSLGLHSGILAMLLMVVLSIPLSICSTSSIPIALSLMTKGLSPGAAFVFLFVGPVANIASIMVVGKVLGKKITAIYITTVIAMSIAFGYLFDYVVDTYNISFATNSSSHAGHNHSSIFVIIISIIFAVLLLKSIVVKIKSYNKK